MNNSKQDKIEILDETLKGGFSATPRLVLRNPNLSRNSKTTYSLLLDYAWQTGSCFPGQQTLANDLGVSVRTVQRDLEELKKFGLIDWKQRGKNRTNIYYILSLKRLSKPSTDKVSLHTELKDTTNMSDPSTTDLSPQDMTETSHIIEEDKYKQKQYKQSLTLEKNNDNENLDLSTFDSEAVMLAKELDDKKSIKYYQKIVTQKNKGEIHPDDFHKALDATRKAISESRADNTNFLKKPAGWFVHNLKTFTQKRKQASHKSSIQKLIKNFGLKSFVFLFVIFSTFLGSISLNNNVVYAESVPSVDELIDHHNEIRIKNGLNPLRVDQNLTESSSNKAIVMDIEKCWSHYCPNGISPWGFFRGVEYEYKYAGENLAYGFESPEKLMDAWMDSKSHKENVLNKNFTEIGISIRRTDFKGLKDTPVVVVHFGKPN